MKKLRTISEKEIINAAWSWYLMIWSEQQEKAKSIEEILGRKSEIFEERVRKYMEIEEELHDLCLELENN